MIGALQVSKFTSHDVPTHFWELKQKNHTLASSKHLPAPDIFTVRRFRGKVNTVENRREVFVVHGRNAKVRDALFTFLRSIDLRPIEWSELVESTGEGAPYIGELLDAAFSKAQAIVVLMNPEEIVCLHPEFQSPKDLASDIDFNLQARPNVIFEAGMAMGRSPDRTIVVELGPVRPFSDLAGRHVIRFDGSTERRQELANRLRHAGCPVNIGGTDWHTAGNFEMGLQPSIEEGLKVARSRSGRFEG